MAILAEATSDHVLDTAYRRLCRRRRDHLADADASSFGQAGEQEKNTLKPALVAGGYRFALLIRVALRDGEEIDLSSARGALALKVV